MSLIWREYAPGEIPGYRYRVIMAPIDAIHTAQITHGLNAAGEEEIRATFIDLDGIPAVHLGPFANDDVAIREVEAYLRKRTPLGQVKPRGMKPRPFIASGRGGYTRPGAVLSRWRDNENQGQRILRAFRSSDYYQPGYRYQANYEHGQWWISCLETGAAWSVVAAAGYGSIDGYDFEQVAEGEEF